MANTLGGDISVVEIPSHNVIATIPARVVGNSPDDVIASDSPPPRPLHRLEAAVGDGMIFVSLANPRTRKYDTSSIA